MSVTWQDLTQSRSAGGTKSKQFWYAFTLIPRSLQWFNMQRKNHLGRLHTVFQLMVQSLKCIVYATWTAVELIVKNHLARLMQSFLSYWHSLKSSDEPQGWVYVIFKVIVSICRRELKILKRWTFMKSFNTISVVLRRRTDWMCSSQARGPISKSC